MSSQTTSSGSSTGFSSSNSQSVQKSGNVASFTNKGNQSGLTAIDTYGNEFKVPDYSIKDILKAIPPHCYERRLIESFYYVFRDIFCMVSLGYVANTFIPIISTNNYVKFALWAGYVWMQGLLGTGIWVLAHECGHQAFSDYGWVNDTVGWVLHSYLLVPYFSWKYSHSKHHKATGHLTRDMVFVPRTKDQFLNDNHVHDLEDLMADSPLFTLKNLLVQQFGGWLAYLATNVTGQEFPGVSQFNTNHFNPNSLLFDKKDYWFIVLSDIGILIQSFILYTWYQKFGGFNILVNYFLPYILVNHWLVFITFLQHSDPSMPHYEAFQWNFARGAAATIDREFGFVGQYIFHDIIETHVLHHYVSRIPFYNAREASEAIKKVMGIHYKHTDENMWVSLWKSGRWCQYVDGDNGVLMYRNVNGFGVDPIKEQKQKQSK
ncbi:fatty acid desaturase-domain-containing protein [Scheffersomyces coipomensis]|uniref:fatty acid desaturase-domain-containing protein n=1 Tax=Scheffersomyces coipomensis TaxID=1788519 RepID=UPI00315DE896